MKWFAQKLLKFIAWILARAPRPLRVSVAATLAFLWFDVFRLRRQVVLANLKIAFPNWTEAQRHKCARESMRNLMITFVDYTLMPFFQDRDVSALFEVEGLEHWHQARAEGKGVLLLTSHVGQGDLGVSALSRLGLPLYLISKDFKNPWLNKMWFGMRAKHGTRFISFHKSLFDILKGLKENAGVIFVMDQFMGPPSGVPTTFFGHPTGTAKGLAMIAERTHAPVVPVYTYGLGKGRHRIVFEPPIPFQHQDDKEVTIRFMTQAYTDKIQEVVQKYPQQWMWIHKRWKHFA